MRLLLLGGTGLVVTEARALALPTGVRVFEPPRSAVVMEDSAAIANVVAAEPWSAVINAAGFTNVDGAESAEAKALTTQCHGACVGLLRKQDAAEFRSSIFRRITCSTGERVRPMSRMTLRRH